MFQSLSDMLVVSELDETLLASDGELPGCNLETIRLFRLLGGHFAVVTTHFNTYLPAKLAQAVDMAVTCGGSILYNSAKEEVVLGTALPHLAARQALRDVMLTFPEVGALVVGDDLRLYYMTPVPPLCRYAALERAPYFHRPYEYLPDAWYKIVFCGQEEVLEAVAQYVLSRTYPGLYFVREEDQAFAMVPKGVSKASAVYAMCEAMHIPYKSAVYVGNSAEDMEAMRLLGQRLATADASKEVKQMADALLASRDEGGIGQYLYELVRQNGLMLHG